MLGYDHHQYTNNRYPFPLDPPFIDIKNPCGVYIIEYKNDCVNKSHFLNIDGADSCVYVYVNNKFVGYSTVSHCNAEFDITNFLNENNNEIRLIVFKWCAMSYLEDQDKLRMSGLGSNSCGPELKKEYQLSEEEFSYKFILNINNI